MFHRAPTCQFRLATFQVLDSHWRLAATILNRVALDSVYGNGVLNHTGFAEFITDFALRTMKAPVCVINLCNRMWHKLDGAHLSLMPFLSASLLF